MLRWSIALILLLLPAAAFAHPGKTDLYGGHKCFKGCEKWGLLYAEYHLHDKDGKAVRVAKKKVKKKASGAGAVIDEAVPATQETAPETAEKPVPVSMIRSAVVPPAVAFPASLLLILLALLLFLLLVRVRRRTDKSGPTGRWR